LHPKITAKTIVTFAAAAVVLYFFAASVRHIFETPVDYQWDLKTYHHAGQAEARGLNPYDLHDLSTVAGDTVWLPFAYSPATLPAFRVLAGVDLPLLYPFWLWAKLIVLAALLVVWAHFLFDYRSLFLLLIFAVFAFEAPAFWDLKAGNIGIFEQAAIWIAFVFFLRGKYAPFVVLIALTALFKLWPIVFLGLLFFIDNKRRWFYLAGGLMLFVLPTAISAAAKPSQFASYLGVLASISERAGEHNLSSLALIHDFFDGARAEHLLALPAKMRYGLYLLAVLAVVVYTWKRIGKAGWLIIRANQETFIFLACAMAAIVLPRFKCYSYLLLVPPALFALRNISGKVGVPLFFIFLVSSPHTALPLGSYLGYYWLYFPLFCAAIVWWILVERVRNAGEEEIQSREEKMRLSGESV
jgi:hypothetical protein